MVSPKAGRNLSHENGGRHRNGSSRDGGGLQRQQEADTDPLDELDLEEGPLLGANGSRATFELQGYQGPEDSAAGGDNGRASILGGSYAPAERRRRCCTALLSVAAAVLLVAVVLLGGFGAVQWQQQRATGAIGQQEAANGLLPPANQWDTSNPPLNAGSRPNSAVPGGSEPGETGSGDSSSSASSDSSSDSGPGGGDSDSDADMDQSGSGEGGADKKDQGPDQVSDQDADQDADAQQPPAEGSGSSSKAPGTEAGTFADGPAGGPDSGGSSASEDEGPADEATADVPDSQGPEAAGSGGGSGDAPVPDASSPGEPGGDGEDATDSPSGASPPSNGGSANASHTGPTAANTFNLKDFGGGGTSQPYARWIYQLPKTWTAEDYQESKAATNLAYAHMSMLTQLPNGSLAFVMQSSTVPGEGNAEQALYWQLSHDYGLSWSEPRILLAPIVGPSGQRLPYWSPVLHTEGDMVHLFFSVSVEECEFLEPTKFGTRRWTPGGHLMMAHSSDNGASWSTPRIIYGFEKEGGIPKVIANKLAVAQDGTWLLPFWRENDPWEAGPACNAQHNLMGVPAVLISHDQGLTWTTSESISHGGSLQYNWMLEASVARATPGMQEAQDGDWLQMFRTEKGVPMYASRSHDGGSSWTVARPVNSLPNPNSKAHLMTLPSGDLLLAFDDDAQMRTPLVFAMSRDGGESWHRVAAVEGHPCGEFSYPTLQHIPEDGRILVAYTVVFAPSKMTPECKERYGKTESGAAEGLPLSGMRLYATTEAILSQTFEAALAGRR